MFNNLSDRLSQTFRNITGRGRLTEDNIKQTLREIRIALLEADVALPVAKAFIETIEKEAIGQDITKSLTPAQSLIKIVHDELVAIMGDACDEINLNEKAPIVILMAGLQGSGKTTTTAKLANQLKQKHDKSVLVASADIYRPAAIQQLETLAGQIGVDFFPSKTTDKPVAIAKNAIKQAKKQLHDIVIIDTAGRLHIDKEMMAEIKDIHKAINPVETLFVVDSMTGQDAANTAKTFSEALPITGVVLTKVDGDARGGAALSVRKITGKPIKFIGTGEKIDGFEPFHPERIASRILGMGDIVSLAEQAEQQVDKKQSDKIAKKIRKGKGFDFDDFLQQLQQMKKLGGMSGIMSKLPGAGQIPEAAKNGLDDKQFLQMEAIIHSMTRQEKRFPALIKGSRRRRISKGSGTEVQDVNRLLKQYQQMQKMMKKIKGKNMSKMMQQMQNQLPPGAF